MSRVLIYSYKSEGTYMPSYIYYKIYENGEVVIEEGSLLDKTVKRRDTKKISKEDIKNIEKLIDDNSRIFSIKKIENPDMILDGSIETVRFSDGQRSNTLEIDNLWQYTGYTRNIDVELLFKLCDGIHKILKKNGVTEDY